MLAACAAALVLAGASEAADARAERVAKVKRPGPGKAAAAENKDKPKPPPGPLLLVVSLAKQRIHVYGSGGLLTQSVVSTGQAGYRTPTGVFSVIQKNRWHRSNIYSGAPMPFMQRITWSGVALHAGVVPGYPASHGCIRLPASFASELWGMTKLGARVVVAPDDAPAGEIAHARLPVPTLTPMAGPTAQAPREAELTKPALIALTSSAEAAQPASGEVKLLNPLERAKAAKAQTAADAVEKAKAAKAAVAESAAKAAEANKAIAHLRDAELALASARSKVEAAQKAVEAAKTAEAAERAKTALAAAEAKVEEATKASEEARAIEATKTPEAFAAARAAWDAESASTAAAAAAKAAERGTEPITVFFSRKTGRVYVRQAWAPIHEAPVIFKDPQAALGTHVYLAVEPVEEGKALRWLSVSLPASHEPEARGRRGEKAAASPPTAPRPHETAASALDRIEMSEETAKLISDKLWTGASLIVSDQAISHETGTYTDFIVLTR